MIIHSDFRDYYDTAVAHGVDTSIHYKRKTEVIDSIDTTNGVFSKIKEALYDLNGVARTISNNVGMRADAMCIVIGPKVFFGVVAYKSPAIKKNPIWCDDAKSIENVLKNNGHSLPEHRYGFRAVRKRTAAERIDRIFGRMPNITHDELATLIADRKSPLMSFELFRDKRNRVATRMTLNPELRETGIVSKIDPYTTFQEISMALTNLCNPEPEMIEIADKYKRDGKGFDEFSFKNRGTKKPRKRRKNR